MSYSKNFTLARRASDADHVAAHATAPSSCAAESAAIMIVLEMALVVHGVCVPLAAT